LIVIVIIGILASALIPKVIGIQARARDVQRKVDIQNISVALMLYYTDNNTYPI
jgi:general secretion pathway protein G